MAFNQTPAMPASILYSKPPEIPTPAVHRDKARYNHIEERFIQKRRQRSSLLFGDRIDSIPCRTTNLVLGWFEEMDEYKNGHLAEWMLGKNRWSSSSHHTTPPPSQNGCSSKRADGLEKRRKKESLEDLFSHLILLSWNVNKNNKLIMIF